MSDSQPEFEAWLIGLMALLKIKPHFGGPLPPVLIQTMHKALPKQQYGDLNPSEIEFCSEYHIPPGIFCTIRKTLQDRKAQLQEHSDWTPENRVITRGEMRALTGMDFYRSERLLEYFAEQRLCIPAWQME
jgi:hypothetical protein